MRSFLIVKSHLKTSKVSLHCVSAIKTRENPLAGVIIQKRLRKGLNKFKSVSPNVDFFRVFIKRNGYSLLTKRDGHFLLGIVKHMFRRRCGILLVSTTILSKERTKF